MGSCAKEPESSTAAFKVMCARHVCLVQLWASVNVVFCALKASGGIDVLWTILYCFTC